MAAVPMVPPREAVSCSDEPPERVVTYVDDLIAENVELRAWGRDCKNASVATTKWIDGVVKR